MVLGLAFTIATNVYDMSTPAPYTKDLGNMLYHSAVVGGLSVCYSMVGKRLLKMKPADLGRLDIEDKARRDRGTRLFDAGYAGQTGDHPCKHHQNHII